MWDLKTISNGYIDKFNINPLEEFQTLVYNYCLFQNFEHRVRITHNVSNG